MDSLNSPLLRYSSIAENSIWQEEKENASFFISRPKIKRETLSLSDVLEDNSADRTPSQKRKRFSSDSSFIPNSISKRQCFKNISNKHEFLGLQFKIFEDGIENKVSNKEVDNPESLYELLSEIEKRSEDVKMQLILEKDRVKNTDQRYSYLKGEWKSQQRRLEVLETENVLLRDRLERSEKRVSELNTDNAFIGGQLEDCIEKNCRLEGALRDLKKMMFKTELNSPRSCSSYNEGSESSRFLSPNIVSAKTTGFSKSIESNLLKVNQCLGESNVSQLQKLLLSFTMENEILNSKLEDAERNRSLSLRSPSNTTPVTIKLQVNQRDENHDSQSFSNDPTSTYSGKSESENATMKAQLEKEPHRESRKSALPRVSLRSDKGCQSSTAEFVSPLHVIKEVRFSFEDSGYLNITPNKNSSDKPKELYAEPMSNINSPFCIRHNWKSSTPK